VAIRDAKRAGAFARDTGVPEVQNIKHESPTLNRRCVFSRLRARSKSICSYSGFICAWFKRTLIEWEWKVDEVDRGWHRVALRVDLRSHSQTRPGRRAQTWLSPSSASS